MPDQDLDPTAVPELGHFLPCSEDAVARALRQQSAHGRGAPGRLGRLLVENGTITEAELSAALYRQRAECLRRCTLFALLDDAELTTVVAKVDEHPLAPGEILLQQGRQDCYLSIVIRGRLEVFRVDPEGHKTTLAVRLPGEHVGEMGFVSKRAPSASVQALGPTKVLRLHYDDLEACIEQLPRLAKTFWEIATNRLHQISTLYEEGSSRQKAAEKSLQHLYSFLDLSETKLIGTGIDGLIENLVHSASKLVDADRASLFLLDQSTGELWSKVAEGEGMKEIRIPPGAGVAGWVAANGKLQNIRDAYADSRFSPEIDRQTGYRTETILCGPIVNLQNDTLGVVQAINKRDGEFTGEDERLFALFSHQAAIAVENFNLYQRIVSNHHKMGIMLDIATMLNETLNLGGLIGKLVTKIMGVLDCERCSFFVYDEKNDELWSLQAVGLAYQEIRFPATIGLAGDCVRSGETVNVEDAYKDIRFNPEFDQKTGYRTRSVLCVPLRNREGRITSVVQAINKRGKTFDADDEELLRAISSQISVAVENSKLHDDTLGMKNYLEGVQSTISSAIVTLDAEDRVVTANRAAASVLGVDDDLTGLHLEALLGEGNDYLLGLVRQVRETGSNAMQYDVALKKRSGSEGTINVNVLPLAESGEDSGGLVLIVEDISSEKRVRSMLTRYMDKEIVDRVLEDPSQQTLGGKRSMASVLFCDIRDFTSVAEGLTAEGTMDLLNEYFTTLVADISRQQGMLDKFIGDAMLAVFGLPFARDDDAHRAVRCALAMRESLTALNAQRALCGKPPIRNGIGINTDEVISGNVGSESRMDYTVIGDGVNVASRLEGLTKHYGTPILISQSTRSAIGDDFVTRQVDNVIVKGRTRPVGIYEVLGVAGCAQPDFLPEYTLGFSHYMSRQFADALSCFRRIAEIDTVSAHFVSRCERLLAAPPQGSWDGVWRAETK